MSRAAKQAMGMLWIRRRAGLIPSGAKDTQTELENIRAHNRRNPYRKPRSLTVSYSEVPTGRTTCLVIRDRLLFRPERAILFLRGGIKNSWLDDIRIAERYSRKAFAEVWFPLYPSIADAPVTEIADAVFSAYREVTERYGGDRVAVVGLSWGGFLGFQIVDRINRYREPVPMPRYLFAVSPGGFPKEQDDWGFMQSFSEKDPLMDLPTVEHLEEITGMFGLYMPDHLLYPANGIYRNAPETYVYYGEETFAGNTRAYMKAYERDGAAKQMHMHIEPAIMHSYACSPQFPEGKRELLEQTVLIRRMK